MRPEKPGTFPPAAATERPEPYLVVTLGSSPLSVRRTLVGMRSDLAALTLDSDAAGTMEIVLAEVMNNICEHAYDGASDGEIRLSVWTEGDMLSFEVSDYGKPMPDGQVPAGAPAAIDCPLDMMPEGGFGWHLIRLLTTDLSYRRTGRCNHLSFRMRRDAQPADQR